MTTNGLHSNELSYSQAPIPERETYNIDEATSPTQSSNSRGSSIDPLALEQEILQSPPRPLQQVNAELLFIDGQLLYHCRDEKGRHQRYFISPNAARVAFLEGAFDTGWIDQSIVRYGDNGKPWFVQFFPPMQRKINLEVAVELVEKIEGAIAHPDLVPPSSTSSSFNSGYLNTHKIERYAVALKVHLPGMIAFVQGASVRLWAVKTKEFDVKAPLFHVPIPNVHLSGELCFGQEPPAIKPGSINRMWEKWWQGLFNADLANQKSSQFPGDIRSQLIQLHITKKRYPLKDLLPVKTIEDENSTEAVIQSLIYRTDRL